jgi:hypothetical protein
MKAGVEKVGDGEALYLMDEQGAVLCSLEISHFALSNTSWADIGGLQQSRAMMLNPPHSVPCFRWRAPHFHWTLQSHPTLARNFANCEQAYKQADAQRMV